MTPDTLNIALRHAIQNDTPKPHLIDDVIIHVVKPPLLIDALIQHTMVIFVLSGEQEMFLGEYCYTVQAGDVFFVPFHLPLKVHFKLDKRPQFLTLNLILDEHWLMSIIQKTKQKHKKHSHRAWRLSKSASPPKTA